MFRPDDEENQLEIWEQDGEYTFNMSLVLANHHYIFETVLWR
jgi:hypothetical protein